MHIAVCGMNMCVSPDGGAPKGRAGDAAQPLKPYRPFDGL